MGYALKAVSAYLGVPPDTVRKWESRYSGLVDPVRLENGYREYSEADLQRLLAFAESRRRGLAGAEAARKALRSPRQRPADRSHIAQALSRLERFDRRGALELFKRSLKGRSVREAFSQLWLPVLSNLGARAHTSPALWISVEHFASGFLRERVLAELSAKNRRLGNDVAVCAPQGDRHELGMLLASCALEECGLGTLYLGADLPLESLEAALAAVRPRGLALSITAQRPRRELRALLTRLRKRFPKVRLFVCGQESLRHANLVREAGAVFVGTDLARGATRIASELGAGGLKA